MAISAEQLNIILTAKDKEFARAMESNSRRIARFSKNANKDLSLASVGFDKLAVAAAAFASIASIQQLGTAVRDAANRLGDLKDSAAAIGITTDALQELTYAAQLSGVSSDLLQSSLQKLTKNLGDAAMGGSAVKQSLDALGLSGAALAAVPVDQALGLIADKLSAVENPAQRASIATDLFGRSGLAMVNMLNEGSAGLNALADEARRLGVVINQSVIEDAAEAADKLDALSMVINANLTQALLNISPLLIGAAQNIAGISKAITDFLLQDYSVPTVDIEAAADEYNDLKKEIDAVTAAQNALNAMEAQGEAGLPPTIENLDSAYERLDLAEAELEAARQKRAIVQQQIADSAGTMQSMIDENAALEEQIRLQALSNEERIKEVAAKKKQQEIEKALMEMGALREDGIPTDADTQKILELADANEQLYIQTELAKTAQAGAAKSFETAKIAASEYEAQIEQLGISLSEFDSISSTIQSSMEDAFMGMVDGTMTAQDAFKSMASEIIKELFRVLVVQRLVGSFGNATTAGSGILGSIGSALGITGNASGGAVYAGQASVVGENGREVFVPSSSGRVLSVSQSKDALNGGAGVTVIQNINVSTGVQQTVRSEIKSLMPMIAESAKAAVFDAQRRSINGAGF